MAQETGLRIDDERDDVNAVDSEDDAALALSDDTGETDDTDEIREQIEETRASMGETIDAIQEKLSLSNISEQVSEQVTNAIETAKDTVYDATLGKAVNFMKNTGDTISRSSFGRSISANPWPYALIGLGSAWLVYSSMSGNKRRYRGDGSQYRVKNYTTSHGRQERQSGGMLSNATQGVSSAAGSAYDAVTSRAGDAYDSVSTTANDAYNRASDAAGRAYDKVGEYGHLAQEKYEQYVEEKPLAVAAAAAAVGAAIGFAIPSTRYEGQLMGETRDQLMSTAGEAAGGLVDKAKQVASEAGKTIKDEISSATEEATGKQPAGRQPAIH